MNWFFNLIFLGTAWSAIHVEEVISSESLSYQELEVIESFFKSSFENASYKQSFDGGRRRLKGDGEKTLEDLSYRHHGSHPANSKSWKLQCVWKAMNNVARHLPQIVSSNNTSWALPEVRKLCNSHAWESCGLDFNEMNCDPNEEYRSIDGTCNNLVNTRWGSAPQPFERFVHSDYGNDVSTFRESATGEQLPNPRSISRALSNSKPADKPQVTLMLTHWGQFLDHDITLTPERENDVEQGAVCPEGFFKVPVSGNQCFKLYPDSYTWEAANSVCQHEGLELAKLEDTSTGAVALRKFIVETYGQNQRIWLGGRGSGSGTVEWIRDGTTLSNSNSAWHPYYDPSVRTSTSSCLNLLTETQWMNSHPTGPLYTDPCSRQYSALCQDPVEGSRTMKCCDRGQLSKSVSLWEDCMPIDVTGDPFYAQDNRTCIRFTRSMPASRGCENSPMEQINQNTAFVDGSMVYGSTTNVSDFVRTWNKGLLNTTTDVGNGNPLPPRGGDGTAHRCPMEEVEDRCFLAGDVRVDEVPGLTAMHTTFIRLHNIIAKDLCEINPSWCLDDEKLFQETRRIVIALIQQITYRDWLPLVVGQTLMDKNHLDTEEEGYSDTYDVSVNPSIRNVFATAAFRFGHSLISEVIKTAKADNNLPNPGNFFNFKLLECDVTSPSSLLKGMTGNPSAPIDAVVEPALTNHLYADHPANDGIFYGLDLVSINIQRGRDHGIPGYIAWREFCGLVKITEFSQLNEFMPTDLVHSFKDIYQKVSDIDLFPAGLAEKPIADGILGPTFSCIIARQFARIKKGDRFWYETEDQPKPFTRDQLSSIRSQDLRSILCKVSAHTSFGFQPNPFLVETKSNAVMDCSSNEFIDLQPWEPQTGCGGEYTSSSGTIRHPLSGSSYENDENCVWTISTGSQIKITFTRFDLENRYDHLFLRDGNSIESTVLGDFTGSAVPSPVQTNSNAAFILFTSDYSVTRTGFELQWETLGCTVDGTAYRNGSLTEDRCILLQCINGAWEYYNSFSEYDAWNECNHCYSTGNTDINMRDFHVFGGIKSKNYHVNENGTYAFSQSGLEIPAQVIMEATIEYINEYHNETHITSVTYKELGIKVELVFPSPNDYEYCNDHPTDPHCEAKILVNGLKITLNNTFSSVASFNGLEGTVFIINRGPDWPWTNRWGRFYIVGSRGTSVRVDYGGWYAVYAVSMAMPSLKNKVFGLCDVFTGGIQTGFTTSNGSVTTDINEFNRSWKLSK